MPVPRSPLAPILVALGLVLLVAGVIAWAGWLSWFGRLPGDLRMERGTVRVYAPIVSMLVVSVALTVLFRVLRRFF